MKEFLEMVYDNPVTSIILAAIIASCLPDVTINIGGRKKHNK